MHQIRNQITIAHVVHSFDAIGGLENGVVNILNALPSELFRHIVCSLTNIGELTMRVVNPEVRYYALHKKRGNDWRLPFHIHHIIRKEGVDVVHLRNWATMVEGYVAARMGFVSKLIYSEHGRHYEDLDEGKWLNTIIKKYIFSRVDELVAVSEELGREMETLYNIKRGIRIIPNGIDTEKFRPMSKLEVRKKYGWGEDEWIVGVVSRLDKVKNLDRFIKAIHNHSLNAKVVVVGDGPEKKQLELLIDTYRSKGKIILLGNRSDVPELLNCFDVFALPSFSEGLSNVILEAMSSGLPIVAFDVGGNKELVVHAQGGYLVDLNDFQQFIESIRQIIQCRDLMMEMAEFNRKMTLNGFSMKKMVDHYTSLYKVV